MKLQYKVCKHIQSTIKGENINRLGSLHHVSYITNTWRHWNIRTMGQFGFKLKNESRHNITDIQVYNVNSSEWHPNKRPDKKIAGLRLASGGEIQERLHIRKKKGFVYFNAKILFDDGSQEVFRFSQGCTNPFPSTIEDHQGQRDISISRHERTLTLLIRDRPQPPGHQPTSPETTTPVTPSTTPLAEKLLADAKDLYINGQYKDALAVINNALNIAKGESIRNALSDLKVKTLIKISKQYTEEAWSEGYCSAVGEAKFTEAKKMALEALVIKSDEASFKNIVHCIDLILDANSSLKLGKKSESEAKMLSRLNNLNAMKAKLNEAKTHYALAGMKYHDGLMCDPGFGVGMEDSETLKNNVIQQMNNT